VLNRLARGVDDVDNALMGAHLEMLTRFLVHMRTTQNTEDALICRQRDWPDYLSATPLCSGYNALDTLIQDLVIEAFKTNSNPLCHMLLVFRFTLTRLIRAYDIHTTKANPRAAFDIFSSFRSTAGLSKKAEFPLLIEPPSLGERVV